MEVTRDVAAGNILFCFKISSEPDYDFLRFYVDDEQQWFRSGEEDWTLAVVGVTKGTHTFRWAYEKDYSLSSGSDAAWIDDIELPAVVPTFRAEETGDVHAAETFYAAGFVTGAADVAEWVELSANASPGDVLVFDPEQPGAYRPSNVPCSSFVAGVVSSLPGVVLGATLGADSQALLALIGIVPVKVTSEGGPIRPGDLLVTSSTPGHAMRWTDSGAVPCALIGKALEPMVDARGLVLVLLMAH